MPTKYCPHCGDRSAFQVSFNIICKIGSQKEKGYMRTCKTCGGRFITIQEDERLENDSSNPLKDK